MHNQEDPVTRPDGYQEGGQCSQANRPCRILTWPRYLSRDELLFMLEGHHTFTTHRKAYGRWSPTLTTPAGRSAPHRWPTQDGVVLFSHKTCAQSRPRRHRNSMQGHAFQLRLCHGAVTTQARQTTSVLARHARRQRHRSVSRRFSVIPSSSVIRLRYCCCCGCLLLVAGQRGVRFLQKARNNA